VTEERVTIEARDPLIIGAGRAAVDALGGTADPPGTIRGDLAASASLTAVWQALHDSLDTIRQRATRPADIPGTGSGAGDAVQPASSDQPGSPEPGSTGPGNPGPGDEAA